MFDFPTEFFTELDFCITYNEIGFLVVIWRLENVAQVFAEVYVGRTLFGWELKDRFGDSISGSVFLISPGSPQMTSLRAVLKWWERTPL